MSFRKIDARDGALSGRADGIDKLLAHNRLDAPIAPTTGVTFTVDPVRHDIAGRIVNVAVIYHV
jgi:hypothetical protein